jgi:ATP-binding cassette subfamily C protein
MNLIKKLYFILDVKSRWQILGLLLMMIVAAGLEALTLGLIFPLIDLIINPSEMEQVGWLNAIYQNLGKNNLSDFLVWLSVGILSMYIVKNTFFYIMVYTKYLFIYNRKASLANDLFRFYMCSPYSFHIQANTATLLRDITVTVDDVFSNGFLAMLDFVIELLVASAIFILLFTIEPIAMIVAVIAIGIPTKVFYMYICRRSNLWGERRQYYSQRMLQWVNQGLGAIKEVLVLGRGDFFIEKFNKSNLSITEANRKYGVSSQLPRVFTETMAVAGVLLILVITLKQGDTLARFLPIMGLFVMATFRLLPTINRLLGAYHSLRFSTSAVDELYREMKKFRMQGPSPFEILVDDNFQFQKQLTVEHGFYNYPNADEMALKDINLTIYRGQSVAFVGLTGGGKTTLADVVLGLLTLTKGRVLVDGEDIFSNLRSWQSKIGYVPQKIYLIDDTIRRNIAFGIPDECIDESRVYKVIEVAHLQEVFAQLPQGLDTVVGEEGVRLSGGQRQCVGIARALYHDPELLVLDEATSAIDNQREAYISKAIQMLRGQKTLIIVSHRMTITKDCDVVYYIKNGKIVDIGTYAELIQKSRGFIKMLYV